MQSSRDSSVWKSLAVAFGDGLAFGVGMKLTTPASRAPVTNPSGELTPLAERLEQIEARLSEMERSPRFLPPAEKNAATAQAFDQKVLEAVVSALDARLRENSIQVERQLTELQARMTIELQTLHRQDQSISEGLQTMIEEARKQFAGEVAALNASADAGRRALEERLAGLSRDEGLASSMQTRLGELEERFGRELAAIRATIHSGRLAMQEQLAAIRHTAEAGRTAMQEQLAGLQLDVANVFSEQLEIFQKEIHQQVRQTAGAAAAAAVEPMRAAVETKDREIAELRARLAGSDETTLDLLQGVGEACRRAAERLAAPRTPTPATPAENDPETASSFSASSTAPPGPPSDESVPGFAQSNPAPRLWRVPLVSSLVLTSGVMLMLHYL